MTKFFAFRDYIPKGGAGRSWDRDEVAKALRQGRVVNKMMGRSGAKAHMLGAADALEERSKLPAKKYSKEWSDNRDREVLSWKLRAGPPPEE